jgi:hypothetical protein
MMAWRGEKKKAGALRAGFGGGNDSDAPEIRPRRESRANPSFTN